MTEEQANDFLDAMLDAAKAVAKRTGTDQTVKINARSVSLHYYPRSDTWNWFFRGRGVANRGEIRQWLAR